MASLSTHVLDSGTGRPASGVSVTLERLADDWTPVVTAVTDADGRVRGDFPAVAEGVFRLTFATGDWFAAQGRECFYPFVTVAFTVTDETHYHVPILLSAYAYSTYRGS
ncbi:hydroxyisourate hydrolase [Kineosporia succinea]|uniref:5-hydroxyisourate hydrolase n=1 Tax=Kineosporia succinea TaxID=84632 RepID=A0ABT9NZP2_9ACTN|nr:hydroxyisourate hydrolase [Kineosporia succinea]MDP9825904.1 5-hydroxyisourate hydrolase [Kineosporia succinea]